MTRIATWLKGLFAGESRACPVCAVLRADVARAEQRMIEAAKDLQLAETLAKEYRQMVDALHDEIHALRRPFETVRWGDTEPAWTAEDRAAWVALMNSEVGRKVIQAATFFEQQCNRSAIRRTDKDENSFANNAGYARGWSEATHYFFVTLSADVRPQQDEDTTSGEGAAAARERWAP
jgi:predicted O-linked N-acetylglucosamine transferase (SPINDLY family)